MQQSGVISSFFKISKKDKRIGTSHLGLYLALLECWSDQQCQHSFFISRSKLMSLSKIQSTSTYHKCINDLTKCGAISYKPSYHPGKRTEIIFNSNPRTCGSLNPAIVKFRQI